MKINSLDSRELHRSRVSRFTVVGLFALMGVLAAVDLVEDLAQGTTVAHLVIETTVVLLSLLVATFLGLTLLRESLELRTANANLSRNLEISQQSAAGWRNETQKLLVGLGESINRQFDVWCLTPVEKDIALFLLKGLSHKEVAYIREVRDATIRQQARVIYQKAGVTGRHGLAAFFLEDLSLPDGEAQAESSN